MYLMIANKPTGNDVIKVNNIIKHEKTYKKGGFHQIFEYFCTINILVGVILFKHFCIIKFL